MLIAPPQTNGLARLFLEDTAPNVFGVNAQDGADVAKRKHPVIAIGHDPPLRFAKQFSPFPISG
jgi:hypothetical protein